MSKDKAYYRQEYRRIRELVKSEGKDTSVFELISDWDIYKSADTVFIYYSIGSEVDTHKIIINALESKKKVALPKCMDKKGNMNFYFIDDIETSLISGCLNLCEPDVSICREAYPDERTLCIVPALAFDKYGNRLGYGGGYYDRFLADFKGKAVGLCYSECLSADLPFDKYDIKVQSVVTDKKIYEFK